MEDQVDREEKSTDWAKIPVRDQHRREQAMQMLSLGEVHTGNDFYHLAMIWQHGSTPNDYLLAHTLATIGIAYGSKDARWLAAATLDRYLRSVWRPQIFGTQFGQQPWESKLSLEIMDSGLVSDPARAVLCVPSTDRRSNTDTQNAITLKTANDRN